MGICCGSGDSVREHPVDDEAFELQPLDPTPGKYGEPLKYDAHFKGPLGKRSCTDVLCLIIFVVFLILWSYIAYFAIGHGDLEKLLVPVDSQGYRCGVDSPVLDKPYLFFFNLEKCISPLVPITGCPTPQVCVKECPNQMFIYETYKGSFEELKSKLICQTDKDKENIKDMTDAKNAIQENRCASWYIPSVPLSRRCLPQNTADILELVKALHLYPADFEKALEQVKLLANINGLGQLIVEDLTESWPVMAIGLILAMILSLVFIAVMRWLAKPMVWLSILGVLGLLGFGIYSCVTLFIYYRDHPVRTAVSPNLAAYIRSWGTDKITWLILTIILSILFIVLLLVAIFLRGRIRIAIALIKEASKAVSSIISTVFFPIIPWIFQVATIVFAIAIGLYLASVGPSSYRVVGSIPNNCICTGAAAQYAEGSYCDPKTFNENCHLPAQTASVVQRLLGTENAPCSNAGCYFEKISNPNIIGYMQAYNVVAFFWVIFFISAFGEMVLAGAFATWYWTFHKSDVPFFTLTKSVGRTTRYHLGTLAFGALIVTICRIIRVILEWIDAKLKKFDNACTRAILCCMKCFFWCLEKFLRFINKNAYIMCAIHGKNFCTSARDAFNLLMRNCIRVIVVDKVTEFLLFLSKLLLTLGLGTATYFYIGTYAANQEIHYRITPTIIVMIGTYLITTVFFQVYSMAVDTLFLCFLEDSERNDGSPEKPFFMSKQLMKILEKRYTSNGLVYTIKSTNVYKKPLRHANQYSKHTKIAHFDKIDEEDQKTV
ncbi:choline transporter-like 2 isoform X4 [Hermetia illucens]|uniref:choline transporter-like 2 isoform X4 n=1 Tax=Hermetia illucens TaxID=343691 RepID=UPI0018CBFF79|nr:choline transporter-like 2 isoform X4 [Hermetia illucens]